MATATGARQPDLDGYTLMRRLAPFELDSALVIMSAHGAMVDLVEALRHAVDYPQKPISPTELVAAVVSGVELQAK